MSSSVCSRYLRLVFVIACMIGLSTTAYGQSSDHGIELQYHENLISLKAEKADIKNILLRISDTTSIYVKFPKVLEKEITVNIKDMPLAKALKKLLRGINHIIIYSLRKKSNTINVSKVYVYDKAKGSYASGLSRGSGLREKRIADQIASYERRIESITQRLNTVAADSSMGQQYTRQIENCKKTIERLQNSIR